MEADPEVLARAIGGKVAYKDPYQYEKDAKAIVNEMIKNDQRFTLSDEMLRQEEINLAKNPIKPIVEKGIFQKFDDISRRPAEEFRAGFAKTEIGMSYTDQPELRGKKGMSHIAGQAFGLVTDNIIL